MNRNMKPVQNPFTHRIPVIKLVVKELESSKFYATLLAVIILVGFFSLSPAISQLMNDVILRITGKIATEIPYVVANSGSATDIQTAVNEAAAFPNDIGNVYIPNGTHNFVEVGEPWMTVNVPAGINLFGAPTERTSGLPEPTYGMSPNDQVVDWKTVLVMPSDQPDYSVWFHIVGTGDPNKPTRFSDIKLSGYRDIDPTSTTGHRAILLDNMVNFRIDHNFFSHTTAGIWVGGPPNSASRGVIDHNKFINQYGLVNLMAADCTVYYGVGMGRVNTDYWDPNIENILGNYLDYTIFIEDNYFSRWRHCTAANHGQHYVFRHNTVEYSGGLGEVDAHGVYTIRGTRAMEVYNNLIVDPVDCQTQYDSTWDGGAGKQFYARGLMWRGGGGVLFNNYFRNYNWIIEFVAEDYSGVAPECTPHDIWIWNNTYEIVGPQHYSTSVGPVNEGEDYRVMGSILPGQTEPYWPIPPEAITYPIQLPGPTYPGEPFIMYTPYPYPHPLTLEAVP